MNFKKSIGNMFGMFEKACLVVRDRENKDAQGSLISLPMGRSLEIMVQYNPATIGLRASAGMLRSQAFYQSDEGALADQVNREQIIVLEVSLLFEQIQNYDAFSDAKGLSLANGLNLLRQTADFVGYCLFENKIRENTQGVLACLLMGGNVTFSWANFSFTGSADEVALDHMMFDDKGEPVLAKLDFRITASLAQFRSENAESPFDQAKKVVDKVSTLSS